METVKGSGYIHTAQPFGDCQLHVEWRAPVPPVGEGQGRGNSGVYLMGKYEIQVLDSHQNKTYPDGQASAVYGQYPPLVNASRPPGEWQTYDIRLVGRQVTVVLNDQKIIDKQEIEGLTAIAGNADEGKLGPIILQGDHGPVEFRNIVLTPLVH